MEYEIRRFEEKHLPDLQYLFREVFGVRKSLEELRAKYDTSYLGVEFIGYLAFYSGKPIAFYGVLPDQFCYEARIVLSAQSVDSMVVKAHQKNGLFTQLAAMTFELAATHKIQFVWGYANQNSEPAALKKLMFVFGDRIYGFKWNAAEKKQWKVFRKLKLQPLIDRRVKRVFQEFIIREAINGSFATYSGPKPYRDENQFIRKRRNGSFFIELDSAKFWVKCENGLQIGDMEANSAEELSSGLQKLIEIARINKLGTIVFQSSKGSMAAEVAERLADETFSSWGLLFRPLSPNISLEGIKATLADIDTF